MSNKRKRGRGVSKCKKAITNFTIEFDENGEAIGKNDKFFMSWVGVEFRKRIPYNKIVQELDNKLYEDVWEYIKESWSIRDDFAKSTTLKKGKAIMRNFRHNLAANYVRKDDTPFMDYDYIVWDQNEWDSFVAKVLSEDFEAQSIEARIHALENIEPARVGRCGFSGMRDEWEKRWNQLVSRYAFLSRVQDERTKEYTVSRAHYNHDTRLYELGPHLLSESENGVFTGTLQKLFDKEKEMRANGTYYQDGKDVVTEVIGKGRQHGGRTRLVSSVIGSSKTLFAKKKKKTKEVEGLRDKIETVQQDQDWPATTVEASPSRIASSYVSGRSYNDLPEIKSITNCYLISPFNKSFPDTVVARGRVYPTSVRTLHFRPIATGFVKVQVDFVYEDCKKLHVLPQTITDEIEEMGDTQGQLIQWPMNSIKVLDVDSHVSLSPPTSPHYVQSPRQDGCTPSDTRHMSARIGIIARERKHISTTR